MNWRYRWTLAAVLLIAIAGAMGIAFRHDRRADDPTRVADFQLIATEALGIASPSHDLNGDGRVDVADVQAIINAGLHGAPARHLQPQLTFSPIPNQILGLSPFPASAKSSTSGATFATNTPSVCATAGDLVTLLDAGTCTIAVAQIGGPVTVHRSFSVSSAKPAITLAAAAGSPFAVGKNPGGIAVGDFNGDGMLDLAVANEGSNNVSVLLGDGAGGFTAANRPIPLPGGPVALAAGDFNADGNLDLAIANLNGNTLSVLLGKGDGTFSAAPRSPFPTGNNPDFVAIGDFNGDGVQDLAVSNLNSNTVTVLLGDGTGSFKAAPTSPLKVGTSPQAVAVGDFNGDGKLDLAIPNYSGSFTVLVGNGSGGFTEAQGSPFATGGNSSSIAVGDFNHDGIEDLAIGTYNTNSVAVLLGNGSGGFTPASGSPFTAGTGRGALAVADFNGGGIQDIVVANAKSNDLTVLLGSGSGDFTVMSAGPFPVGTEPVSVAVGDFNHDGIEDLAIVNLLSNNVTVLLGTGANLSRR